MNDDLDERLRSVERSLAVLCERVDANTKSQLRFEEETRKNNERYSTHITWFSRIIVGAILLSATNFILEGRLVKNTQIKIEQSSK